MPFDAGGYGIGRRSITSVPPSARGGHTTCGIPIGSFLGQAKSAKAHGFFGLSLPRVIAGFHNRNFCFLRDFLTAPLLTDGLSSAFG